MRAALLVALLVPLAAGAATITVDTTADSGSGNCTLSEAVAAANADSPVDACGAGSGDDIVDLTGLTGTITLGGSLLITTDVAIEGPGARMLRISGATSQLIRNDNGATVSISDVTIADVPGVGSFSSCITPCDGSLTLERVRVTNCVGSASSFPFPSNAMGPAIATNCGAANLTIVDSTFDDNHTTGGTGANGGAIWWAGAALKIVNTTFSGNTTNRDGGALYVIASTATLDNVTFDDNAADGTGDAVAVAGGGTIVLRNTVAADSVQDGNCADLGGTITSSYMFSDDATCGAANGSQTNVTVGLGALADNGGPTDTHLPDPASPLIDAGDPAGCTDETAGPLLTDQRGTTRPQGSRCDVGAVEVEQTTTTTSSTSTSTTSSTSTTTSTSTSTTTTTSTSTTTSSTTTTPPTTTTTIATTTTIVASTTTTTLPVATCGTIDDCLADLASTLPASSGSTDVKPKRAARKLGGVFTRVHRRLFRATERGNPHTPRYYYRRAGEALARLLEVAQLAEQAGTLGVPLGPLQGAAAALLAKIPS